MKRDREKWESRYKRERRDLFVPDEFLSAHEHLLRPGRALDLACGLGANSLFLSKRGFGVDAVDISLEACSRLLAEARRIEADVRPFVADLDYYPLPEELYDVVLVFYFFSPPLIPAIKASLKAGGLLFYATYNCRHTSVKPGFNVAYLVAEGALSSYFSDFEIIVPEEVAGDYGNVSRLAAVKV